MMAKLMDNIQIANISCIGLEKAIASGVSDNNQNMTPKINGAAQMGSVGTRNNIIAELKLNITRSEIFSRITTRVELNSLVS